MLPDDGPTVEHINCHIVWPATLDALASILGVKHTLGTTLTESNLTS